MSKNKSVYIVWCPGKGLSGKKHTEIDHAEAEAYSECNQHPNTEVFILRAIKSIKKYKKPYEVKMYSK